MKKSNIREVILSLKNAIANISAEYDNFERVLSLYFESFEASVKALFPFKYFAVREDDYEEYQIAIFDDETALENWIEKNSSGYECYQISESRFFVLSQDEWDTPNCYFEEDGVLMFSLR